MPKKSKSSKTPPKKKTTKKKDEKIPAKVGARSRDGRVEVVAEGTGVGGVGSRARQYKPRRSKAEILAEKQAQARRTLGIPEGQPIQMYGRAPMGQRQPTQTRVQQPVGGFTGLTEGYGVTPNATQRIDERLRKMEVRILNQINAQNEAVRANENENKRDIPRQRSAVEILTEFKPVLQAQQEEQERQAQRQQALRESERRGRQRARNYRNQPYTPAPLTEAQLQKEKQIEARQKEKSDIDKQIKLRQESTTASQSILSNIIDNSLLISEQREREEKARRQRILRESQERGKRVFKQEKQREGLRRADDILRGFKPVFDDMKRKEREKAEKEFREQQERERKELRKQIETAEKEEEVRPAVGFPSAPLPSQVEVPQVLQDVDELINVGQTTIIPQPTTEERLQDIQDTQTDIEQLTQQLAEQIDDEGFDTAEDVETDETDFEELDFDLPALPPRDPERPLPPAPHKPLPPISQSTQTTNIPSDRDRPVINDPQAVIEINRLREMARPRVDRPLPIPETDAERLTRISRDRPPIPPIPMPDLPEPKQVQRSDASEIVSGAIDRAFDTATRRITEREQREREERRKQRLEVDEKNRRDRGRLRAERDRQRRSALGNVEEIVDNLVSRSVVASEGGATGTRRRGQGRKPITTQDLERKFRNKGIGLPPDELGNANNKKLDLQRSLTGAIETLYSQYGLNGVYLPFNARDLGKITNRRYDAGLRDQILDLLKKDRRPEVRDLISNIMGIVDNILSFKEQIKNLQNEIDAIMRRRVQVVRVPDR